MQTTPILVVIGYMAIMMSIGFYVAKKQIKDSKDYMIAGRRMGLFMVAFSLSDRKSVV